MNQRNTTDGKRRKVHQDSAIFFLEALTVQYSDIVFVMLAPLADITFPIDARLNLFPACTEPFQQREQQFDWGLQ